MECRDRQGNNINQNEMQNSILHFLYDTGIGRLQLKWLTRPWVSKLGGAFLNTPISTLFIKSFIKNNNIDMTQYEDVKYASYNDFFTRKIKPDARKIDYNAASLIAPCDSKLTAYQIRRGARFTIKNTEYTLDTLLRSRKIAKHYVGGQLLVFRLTVDDYHRYCYIDSGKKTNNYHLKGIFHTVNPLANDVYPIYKENTREFSILKSENFGNVLMMEVGALMVGKISNNHEKAFVKKGEEKGHFDFGGSTVIICLENGAAAIDKDILENSKENIETVVKYGEKIGVNNG